MHSNRPPRAPRWLSGASARVAPLWSTARRPPLRLELVLGGCARSLRRSCAEMLSGELAELTLDEELTLLSLPDELIRHVLSSADASAICSAGRTCKQLAAHVNAPAVWDEVYERRGEMTVRLCDRHIWHTAFKGPPVPSQEELDEIVAQLKTDTAVIARRSVTAEARDPSSSCARSPAR
jgi:hypothetical protein